MADASRGWLVALASLTALLVVGAISSILIVGSLAPVLDQGISFETVDDPAFLEYIRLQVLSQTLGFVGAPLTTAAGLAIVALLVVLARRWDARAVAAEELRASTLG